MNEISDKKLDLFEIADQNAEGIENHYKEIKKNYRDRGEPLLEEFVSFVKKNWLLSINLWVISILYV